MNKDSLKRTLSSGDKNFIEVLRHSFWAFAILVGATGIQFLFDLLLAQQFGARGYGLFYLSFTVLMTLALIGRLGLDRAVVRFIPEYIAANQPDKASGVVSAANISSLALTIPMAIILFLASDYIANSIFNEPTLTLFLQIFSLAIPPFALSYVQSGVLKSIKRTSTSLFLERISVYSIGIISIFMLGDIYGIRGVVIGFTIACYATALFGVYVIHRNLPLRKQPFHFSKRRLLVVAGPLLFVMFATQMNGQASVLLLGILSSSTDVGVFNVALKISMLMTLVLTAITTITATKISELYHSGKKQELSSLLIKTSALGTICSLPILIFMIIFPQFLLGLFGEEFTVGSAALVILAFGQFVNVSVGATAFALGMTGHERALAVTVGVALVINILLGVILISAFGVVGASIATGIAIAGSNLAMVYLVKRYLGVWQLPFAELRTWLKIALK